MKSGNIQVTDETILQLVNRLEIALGKIEGKQTNLPDQVNTSVVIKSEVEEKKLTVFGEFWKRVQKLLGDFKVATEDTKIPDLAILEEIVREALCTHQDILFASENFKKPTPENLQSFYLLFKPFSTRCSDLGWANKEYANHADAIKNGLDTLYWVGTEKNCDENVQCFFETIDSPGNKVFMKKVPAETKWIKAYKAIIKEVNELVKANFKLGLDWNYKGDDSFANLQKNIGNTYLNKSIEAPANQPIPSTNATILFEGISSETREADLNLITEQTPVHIINCQGSTFKISKKVNYVKLENSKNVTLILDSSSLVEVLNSEQVKIQFSGKVNSFNIDNSKQVNITQ